MKPEVHESSFVAKSAVIIGNVKIGKNCGIFPNAVIRGDDNTIEIGDKTNVQDCCVIHCDEDHSVRIGKNVTIGHCAMIHGVLNGARIGKGSIIGANSLVKANMNVPENSMVLGVPGKVIKQDKKISESALLNAEEYQRLIKNHKDKKYQEYNPQ